MPLELDAVRAFLAGRSSHGSALAHPDPTLTSSELSLSQVAVWADDVPDMGAEPEDSFAPPADSRDGLR
eukprot:14697380-Alexandrium_andersonii.AAC.1